MERKPKKSQKLKPNERLFVDTYVKLDFNGTQAAKQVYGIQSYSYAALKANRLINNAKVAEAIEDKRKTLKQALIDKGVTEDKIAEKVNTLLEAKDEAGQTDFNAVDKGLKHATNIYGVADPDDKPKGNNTYNFIFNAETQEKIKAIEAEIKQKLINPDVK